MFSCAPCSYSLLPTVFTSPLVLVLLILFFSFLPVSLHSFLPPSLLYLPFPFLSFSSMNKLWRTPGHTTLCYIACCLKHTHMACLRSTSLEPKHYWCSVSDPWWSSVPQTETKKPSSPWDVSYIHLLRGELFTTWESHFECQKASDFFFITV